MQTNNIPLADLRIGNMVYSYLSEIGTGKVISIETNWIFVETINEGIIHKMYVNPIDDPGFKISGIPITEEWLIRAGFILLPFEDKELWEHSKVGGIYIECDGSYFWLQRSYRNTANEYEYVTCSNVMKFVNDLQNCFYFLTGTELTLK